MHHNIIRPRMNSYKDGVKAGCQGQKTTPKKPSMTTLVSWNVSKALEHNPRLDLKEAIKSVQERLQESAMVLDESSRLPEERYLACALLAWQRLGHSDADSLYSFVAIDLKEKNDNEQKLNDERGSRSSVAESFISSRDLNHLQNKPEYPHNVGVWRMGVSTSIGAVSLGPVLKIPPGPKTVMRMEDSPIYIKKNAYMSSTHQKDAYMSSTHQASKMEEISCFNSECATKLENMDRESANLRKRAIQLARREAERGALLERAEAAWRDLEAGYQHRLMLATEKEEDILKQNEKVASQRNELKAACNSLVSQLEAATAKVEMEKAELSSLEKEVCARAVERAQLLEKAALSEARLADVLCQTAQFDRTVAFREQQMVQKQQAFESEVEGVMALKLEADRAMRAELLGLLDQVQDVARDLMAEDNDSCRFTCDLQELRAERDALSDDLEACQAKCDAPLQKTLNDIKKKREELSYLREKELECRCKRPVDKSVTVKRTASLAAVCECGPEDALKSGCSCTSMRGRVLSDLLSDLFRGLQTQMCEDTVMPCQMLKCLEDSHRWDGASNLKTTLRNYFSKLLLGELDIAIATSIENYHAKWVGESCADKKRAAKTPCGVTHSQLWQQKELEYKAKTMAEALAEQMFQHKAQQLADQAKEILAKSGRPPCECHPLPCVPNTKAVFQCMMKPATRRSSAAPMGKPVSPLYLRQTLEDVNSLRTQIKNFKKDTVYHEDLIVNEKNFLKTGKPRVPIWKQSHSPDNITKKTIKKRSSIDTSVIQKPVNKRKQIFRNNVLPKTMINSAKVKRSPQTMSVNMCFIDPQKELCTPSKLCKRTSDVSKLKISQSQLLKLNLHDYNMKQEKTTLKNSDFGNSKLLCTEEGSCFHKIPSNTSIDKLLETLSKWKEDLVEFQDKCSLKPVLPYSTIVNHHQISTQCINNSSKSIQVQNESYIKKGISKLVVSKLSSQKIDPSINEEVVIISPDQVSTGIPLNLSIESEFLGDVNLEKSSISYKNDKNIAERQTINKKRRQISIGCIGSVNCPCTDCITPPVCHEQGLDAQSFIGDLIPRSQEYKHDYNVSPTNVIFNKECAGYAAKSIFGNVVENSGIKCLGVTLTNVHSRNALKTKTNPNIKKKKTNENKDFNDIINQKSIPYTQSYVFKKNQTYVANVNHIQANKTCTHKSETMCDSNICICCKNIHADNCKDLEVNTFQLLEEHVKGELEEFKKSFCDSSCIPTAEEEKLFTTILKRIKLLIAENSRPLSTCKCRSNSDQVNGSWNRAYNLLQEYLKTKMDRATCQCCSDSKNKSVKDLPKVLNKISLLIENDLQKIKSICKCKNAESVLASKNLSSNTELKDKNTSGLIEDLKKSIFITHNISAQVSHESMEAKSCTAMTIDHKFTEVQTVDEKKPSKDEYCSVKSDLVIRNNECPKLNRDFRESDFKNTSKKTSSIHVKIQQSLSKETTQKVDKKNRENSDAPLPYIGYTLNCCCNSDLGCVCTKSTVRESDDRLNINNIWKNLTTEKAVSKNLSQMLDNIPDKFSKDMNYSKFTGGGYKKNIAKAKSVHVTKMNVRETVVNQSNINRTIVAHEGTNTVKLVKNHKSDLNLDNLCEFSSKQFRRGKDSFHTIKHNTLHDLYLPGDHFQLSENSDIASEKSDSCSTTCDCKMVPICHVKMLVSNIEDKLANAQCTCDSLSPKVCPIHS